VYTKILKVRLMVARKRGEGKEREEEEEGKNMAGFWDTAVAVTQN
jgi:hypothetical protein